MANITINNENTTFTDHASVIGAIYDGVQPENNKDEKSKNDAVKDVAGSVVADVIGGGIKTILKLP